MGINQLGSGRPVCNTLPFIICIYTHYTYSLGTAHNIKHVRVVPALKSINKPRPQKYWLTKCVTNTCVHFCKIN